MQNLMVKQYNGNPFDADWLNMEIEESPALVENELGESFIIEPLVKVVTRIVEFNVILHCAQSAILACSKGV